MILPGSLSAVAVTWVITAHFTSTPAIDSHATCREARGEVAIEACDRVLRAGRVRVRDLADTYINRGQAHYVNRELDAAIWTFDQAIRLDPSAALAFGNRANAWLMKNNTRRALTDYDRALAIDPDYTAAYAGRGLVYEAIGDVEKARADYLSALALEPKYRDGTWAHTLAQQRIGTFGKIGSSAGR